jgi:uncharacterized membrane protein
MSMMSLAIISMISFKMDKMMWALKYSLCVNLILKIIVYNLNEQYQI